MTVHVWEGNVYFSDTNDNRVRKVTSSTGIISTIAGPTTGFSGDGGAATSAALYSPWGIAIDTSGMLYTVILPVFHSDSFYRQRVHRG